MKKGLSNEAKTGIMVVVCAVLLLVMVAMVGEFRLLEKGYEIRATFDYVSGVERGAPVRVSGVEAGQVREIKLHCSDSTLVELVLYMEPGAKIREDSKIYVATLGLMGEKYVEITGGSAGAKFVEPGAMLRGVNPPRMEDLLELGKDIVDNVNATLADIRKFANSANGVIDENKEGISQIVENMNITAKNFAEFSEDIKKHPWKLLSKGKDKD